MSDDKKTAAPEAAAAAPDTPPDTPPNTPADAPREDAAATGASAADAAAADASTAGATGGPAAGEDTAARLALLPKPTFSTFILSLASSALVHLGEVPDPATGGPNPNAPAAKHTIDLLTMLQEKIEKGVDADEKRLLEGLLYELRMKYVLKK